MGLGVAEGAAEVAEVAVAEVAEAVEVVEAPSGPGVSKTGQSQRWIEVPSSSCGCMTWLSFNNSSTLRSRAPRPNGPPNNVPDGQPNPHPALVAGNPSRAQVGQKLFSLISSQALKKRAKNFSFSGPKKGFQAPNCNFVRSEGALVKTSSLLRWIDTLTV